MLAQLVKACVGQADVQRFEPHLGHNRPYSRRPIAISIFRRICPR